MPEPGALLYTAGWPSKHGGAKKTSTMIMEEVLQLGSEEICRNQYFGIVNKDQFCIRIPFSLG
jgi:hypothetical protein